MTGPIALPSPRTRDDAGTYGLEDETVSPGGGGGSWHSFKVTNAEEEDDGVPGAPARERGEDGERATEGAEVVLKDTGAKVKSHQRGGAAR